MFYGQSREEIRKYFFDTWAKRDAQTPLSPFENMMIDVISCHPEYHHLLEDENANIDKDYSPEGGESNPFLHMALHIALIEQVSTNRPQGISAIYDRILSRYQDKHEGEHVMVDCLAEMIWESQRSNTPPDDKAYIERLNRL